LRKHLLALGFSFAGNKMTDETVKELQDVFRKMERAVKKADVLTFCRCSQDFDDIVLDVADIVRLRLVIEFLGKQTLRYRHIGFRLPGRIEQSLEAHRRILEAFKERDGNKAGERVYEIIEKAGDTIVAHLFDEPAESLEDNNADKAAYAQPQPEA
jgi:DNA-binding GntR family transcriptional regulator